MKELLRLRTHLNWSAGSNLLPLLLENKLCRDLRTVPRHSLCLCA